MKLSNAFGGTALAVLVLAALTEEGSASTCPSSNLLGAGLVNNVCWECIFPLRISGVTLFGSPMSNGGSDRNGFPLSSKPRVPDGAADNVVCLCSEGPAVAVGLTLGMWLPSSLYETTLKPGCSPTLGGAQIGISDPLYLGTSGEPTEDLSQQSFNHVHIFSYPIVALMELFTRCETFYSDIDMLYMSELDPLYSDPIVSMYGNPLAIFGSSVVAQAACTADAIASSAGEPMDELFWCGGSWTTTMSPYTGYEHAQGPIQFSSSTAQKLLAMNAARGITKSKKGDGAVCDPVYQPRLQRGDYRWQVAWPNPEGTRNHGSGESVLRWGAGRVNPGIQDMPIYLLWEWTDCCAPILGTN